jgi:hypothetical protein
VPGSQNKPFNPVMKACSVLTGKMRIFGEGLERATPERRALNIASWGEEDDGGLDLDLFCEELADFIDECGVER